MRKSLVSQGVTSLWHVAQWVSRAPPHHTLPDFLNLNGNKFNKLNLKHILLEIIFEYFGLLRKV